MKEFKQTNRRLDGSVSYEEWLVEGRRHRTDGPAYVCYYEDRNLEYEAWYVNGKLHRENGPARISYNSDGSILYEEWWIYNRQLTEEKLFAWHRNRVIDTIVNDQPT